MTTVRFPRERRHTLYFLDEIRAFSPVFLDTEVDMTGLSAHRQGADRRYSLVSYVTYTAGRVLARHPAANAAIRGRISPRLATYPCVNAKITLDKTLNGQRVVLATVLRSVDEATLASIQDRLEHFRDGDPERMAEFAGLRALHRLPAPIGRLAFRRVVRPLRGRAERLGTIAVTSLSHQPVDGFHSVGGTTVTLGLGRVADRPVARSGQVRIAPTMRLSLAFDHRVIDGAQAADVLAEIKDGLESFSAAADLAPSGAHPPAPRARTGDRT
jgi:pyruvate/2-oxoglutarate dehydrogenase complex dihydrolipoamide acyltransferase (E2) component